MLKQLMNIFRKTNDRPIIGSQLPRVPSDRYVEEESQYMSMAKIDSIMADANSGDPGRLYKLAMELMDKNFDIRHAIDVRVGAVMGIPWDVTPASKSQDDIQVAEALKYELENAGSDSDDVTTTRDLISSLAFGVYVGASINEIIWGPGGSLQGFVPVELRNVTFRESYFNPALRMKNGSTILLARENFIVSMIRDASGDPSRGGLIRVLAYLHCFFNLNFKYLMRFLEKHGMPFITAKVGQTSWENEREAIKAIIRNFGSDGGGVINKDTELELVESASKGEGYFQLLDYCAATVQRIVLGQTASSSSGGGLSRDNAQAQVRQDILESDCVMISSIINSRLVPIWMGYNYGADWKLPKFVMKYERPEDEKAKSEALQQKGEALGSFVRAGLITPDIQTEASAREMAGLPPPSQAVIDFYQENDGVRQPVTLKSKGEPDQGGFGGIAMSAIQSAAKDAQAADKWLATPAQKILAFINGDTDELPDLNINDFDNAALADHITAEMIDTMTLSKLREAKALADRIKSKEDKRG